MAAQIIYLNGPSSAGKSSIAKLLQARLPSPYLHIGIDHVIGLMPASMNDFVNGNKAEGFSFHDRQDADGHLLRELHIGPYGRKIASTYIEIVALLARLGHGVIVGDVAIRPGEIDEWEPAFAGRKVLRVGVTAGLADLEAREKARGDRPPGSARAQLEKIQYDDRYALIVNTSERGPEDCAAAILDEALRF
jgi:chloramphenicol 3-O phosphotransferase